MASELLVKALRFGLRAQQNPKRSSRPLTWLLVASMLATQLTGLLTFPAGTAHAQSNPGAPVGETTLTLDVESGLAQTAQTPTRDEEIVYIDNNGFIRVIDPFVPDGRVPIRWSSPSGGWQHFALGDVNGDGDMEIIAIAETAGVIRLTVYDPVLASGGGTDPSRVIDGVPWDILYETTFNGTVPLVAAGNFDRAIFADEIFLAYRLFQGGTRALILNAESLNPQTQRPNGRDWKIHVDQLLDISSDYVDVGDITNNGLDEIVLVERAGLSDGAFRVYEGENNFRLLGRFGRSDSIFFNVAVGNIIPGTGAEIAVGSNAGRRNNLFVVSRLPNGNLDAGENQFQFVPPPMFIFLADLTGSGDKEMFFLRTYTGTDRDRLIMRNDWGPDVNDTATFEVRLDNDNGYRVGAGGDFNGNGREEIAIMRNDRIRLYTEPVRGPAAFTDFLVDTNSRSIRFGNLDAVGSVSGPQIQVTPGRIDGTVEYASQGVSIGQISVANVSTPDVVQVAVQALNPDNSFAGFIAFSPTPTGNTPAGFNVLVNAGNLNPGVYTGNIRISSPDTTVVNLPIDIPFSVRVLEPPPPGFSPLTPASGFIYYRCSDYFDMINEEEPANGDPENGENNGDNGNGEPTGVEAATLGQFTIPQTVTISFRDTPGATGSGGRVSLAVVAAPTSVAAASTDGALPAQANIVDAFVDHNGDVILVDSAGGRTLVEINSPESAAVTNFEWPSLVPWVTSVRTNQERLPFQVTIVGDLYPLIKDLEPTSYIRERAVLVVVGDDIYGPPPRNVRIVPLSITCTDTYLSIPEMNYGFDF